MSRSVRTSSRKLLDRNSIPPNGSAERGNFAVAVAPLSLVVIAYPTIDILAPRQSGSLLAAASILLAPLVIGRTRALARPTCWLLALCAAYGVSAMSATRTEQAFTHTLTLVCVAVAFLTFALYGQELLEYPWFGYAAGSLVLINILSVWGASLPKNAEASSLFYGIATLIVLLLHRGKVGGFHAATLFCMVGVLISLSLGVRSLVVYSALLLVAYVCSTKLPPRAYQLVGIAICSTVIIGVSWFFLNIYGSPFAAQASYQISEMSGQRADSGRQFLWPYILHAVEDSQLFGLGAGTLPRDVVSTHLSSHNYYLQVYLQLGLVGVTIVIAFLLSLWSRLSRAATSAGKFGSALFLVFVVHNGTEVLMFQNQTLIGVPAWCAIGLAFAADRSRECPSKT